MGRPPLAALHEVAAVNLIQPVHLMYRWARPGLRQARAAFTAGMKFRRASDAWSQDQRMEWVLRRLRETVRSAHEDSPYYRALLDDAGFDPRDSFEFDDFARLPVLEREHIRDAGTAILTRNVAPARLRKDSTGGSSGQPTEVWRGPRELGWNESGTEHFMRRIGLPKGSSTGLLWGHHLDPVGSDRLRDRIRFAAENLRWYDCLRLSPAVFARYHSELARWRPSCVIAYAGALGAFAEYLAAEGVHNPGYPGQALVTGAEKLLPHHRSVVERVFNRPVHERYGMRDVALLGFQLAPWESLDYTVDWANVLVEPESGDPESPILVTKLNADAMPMIRYRVGDLARFPTDSRPGHPAFVLHDVLGREVDRIWLPDGRWFNGLSFPHLLKDYGISMFQVIQQADFSVSLNIVPTVGFRADAKAEIMNVVAANLEGLPVTLQIVDDIPRTRAAKWLPVVSRVDGTRFSARS